MTWQSISVCEGCLGKVTYKGPDSGWLPEGWTQCGMSKLPMKVGVMALWCPTCQQKYLTPKKKSLADLFLVEELPMEAQISGKVEVTWPQQKPAQPKPTLRESIASMSAAAQKLVESGLNNDAIIVLLHDKCGVTKNGKRFSKTDIGSILKHLKDLERAYCK